MENFAKPLPISDSELEWKKLNKEIVTDLEIPLLVSSFPDKDKNLCESSVDLVCSSSSKPCSG